MIDTTFMVEQPNQAKENRERTKQLQEAEIAARIVILAHDHFLRAEAKSHRGGLTPIRFGKETNYET